MKSDTQNRTCFRAPLPRAFSLYFPPLFVLLFCAVLSLPASARESYDAGPSQGIYQLSCVLDTDFVLDVRTCTEQDRQEDWNDQPLQLYRSLDVNQQKFYLEKLPGELYRIGALHSGKILTACEVSQDKAPDASENPSSSEEDGKFSAPIILESLQRSPGASAPEEQTWILTPCGDGCFYLQSSLGGYLTMDEASVCNGACVSLRNFSGSRKQKWILKKTWISETDTADTDLINPFDEDGPCRRLRILMNFGEETETLTASELLAWTKESQDHQIILDEEALAAYIDRLAQKYDTQGCPRKFTTSGGSEITLYKGDFGWKLDKEKNAGLLKEAAYKGGLQRMEPVWAHQGKGFVKGDDIGDSYVEVDLTNQKVWLYKNGKLLLKTDCVTGTLNTDRQTPGGVYSIFYLQSPAVLRGADYASPVQYWMAFNGNIGFHDASWRSSFGGDIYKTNGSHGCVNLPTDAAAALYEHMEMGYPVVCYN